MKQKTYRLELRGVVFGTVHQDGADFPSVWGTFTPVDLNDHLDLRRFVENYRRYSMEADRLLESGDASWDDFVDQNEGQFLDIIDCEDWFLIEATGERHGILIPNFTSDGGVVWRWNPDA